LLPLNLVLGKRDVVFALGVKVRGIGFISDDLPVDPTESPGGGAETGGLKAETDPDDHVDDGVGEEREREVGGEDTPDERSEDRSDDGSEKTGVDELLETIGGLEGGGSLDDVLVFLVDGEAPGGDEHESADKDLASNEELSEVACP